MCLKYSNWQNEPHVVEIKDNEVLADFWENRWTIVQDFSRFWPKKLISTTCKIFGRFHVGDQ